MVCPACPVKSDILQAISVRIYSWDTDYNYLTILQQQQGIGGMNIRWLAWGGVLMLAGCQTLDSAMVNKYAAQHHISPSLVYAVIRTESNFYPYAVSAAPPYGLMQLVPTSGGRDAYRKVTGSDGVPNKEYLFDSANNIELGTAYLNILAYNQLEGVGNDVSREYCLISAYNTGAGNVLKVFSRNRTEAVNAINRSSSSTVYKKLRAGLPYQETRDYLKKVVDYRKQFVSIN